ncbi:MAG TPA: carboxy terminal-processing peptidase [Sphingobacteriaceae bacterium]|nr:carboxy terminal-processing peptidase [Sphingobacteriaceae bacterium]
MLKRIVFVLLVTSIVACGSKPRVDLEGSAVQVMPTAQHAVIVKEVVGLFENYSYKKVPLGDSISSIVYDNLLSSLDDGKNYLMKEDVVEFETYRYLMASDFKKGDLSAAYQIFNTYISRYLDRMEFALKMVDEPHEFSIQEHYVYNRKDQDWFSSQEESDEQWRKRVKYDLLNLRLSSSAVNDSTAAKNRETLKNRYTQLISQAKKTDNNEAFQVIVAALTDAIDPHTSYFNPYFAQQFNEGISNTFEGIGARLTMENEVVRVAEVIAGGPVFKEKALQIDDRIIAVAQGEDGEFIDIIGWRLDNAVAKIKGPKGTVVRLKVIPAGQELTAEPKIVSLTREKIVLEEESAKKEVRTIKGEDGKPYKLGIISIPKFYIDFEAYRRGDPNYKSTTRDVRLIIDSLKEEQVDGILMDLRFNGGGSLVESIELTGLFIDKGPVVQVRDTRNRVEINGDDEEGVAWDGPLGVIINRFSASASEIFAGAIQDYGRGLILGGQSYGKGTVQSAIDMTRVISPTDRLLLKAKSEENASVVVPTGAPQFGQINITMAKFYRITGSSTQHRGVTPDITFPSLYDSEKYGEGSQASALPWDQIQATNFTAVSDLTAAIHQLESKHQARMSSSPEYRFLLEDIESAKIRENEVSVSLNEAILKAERDENQRKNRERINEGLRIRGLAPWKEGEPQPKIDFDFIMDESLHVMADFISMKR